MRTAPAAGLAFVGLTALALAGCGGQAPGGAAEGVTGGSAGGSVSVLAAFYPYEFVAARVGGDHVAVRSLTDPGVEPHDVELTPRQVREVADADLVVYEAGFQPAIDDAIRQLQPATTLDATTVVPLEDGGDPHLWLDPSKLAKVATAVGGVLAEADPAHADDYRAHAATLADELTALDRELADGLSRCERREFVTSHAAFGYLARRYGLEQVPISGLAPEAEPTPARIREVATLVEARGVTTIFYETLVSPKVAETLAADLGVRTAVLDPVEGLAAGSSGDYLSVMRDNLAALRTANGCR